MSLRVLHTVASVGDSYGGVATALAALGAVEQHLGHDPSLVTIDRPEQGTTLLSTMTYFDVALIRPGLVAGRLHGGLRLTDALRRLVPQHDLIVLHGVFDLTSVVGGRTARRFGVPYLLWPHGSLDPYDLAKHRWAKSRLSSVWREHLSAAGSVVCTTQREAARLHTFGATPRTAVLPLPVAAPTHRPDRAAVRAELGLGPGERLVVFCGRIDGKKGLPLLLDAFADAAGPGDRLVVAGSGDPALTRALRARADGRVSFPGWVDAAGRARLLAAADVFALVSDNENFSVATAEALHAGVPALLSDQVYLADELLRHGAAVVCGRDREQAAESLRALLADGPGRRAIGAAGARWAAAALDVAAVGARYADLVRTVMRGCPVSVY
ncbi:glycosyltransferase [Actinokineospora guangxiensis]|uniref:Glycosyltransferase n=1 Tax=Actinokineospora guangxiensis TaxID=1490288 RepID=A0ABW0EGR8_9PSEU